MIAASNDPFFTNDIVGFVRFIGSVLIGISPIFALIIWWMRKGPDRDIAEMKRDVGNIGEKVDGLEKLALRRGESGDALKDRVTRAESEEQQTRERVVRQEAEAKALRELMAENHRAITEMMLNSGERQLAAVHHVELQVARLDEKSNIADCLSQLGSNMERTVRLIMEERKS